MISLPATFSVEVNDDEPKFFPDEVTAENYATGCIDGPDKPQKIHITNLGDMSNAPYIYKYWRRADVKWIEVRQI